MSPQTILVLVITLVCAITDLINGKIYNNLTYPAAAAGLLLSFVFAPPDITSSVSGLVVALCLYGLMCKVGGMGAGDAKLMAAIGALKGLSFLLYSSFYIFCAGSLVGVIVLALNGRLLTTTRWIAGTLVSAVVPGWPAPALEQGGTSMSFGPAIFLGIAVYTYIEGGWLAH